MGKNLLRAGLVVAALAATASAQVSERRASLTGGRGDEGKCTIEVEVDGAADVEISGDRGRIATLSGQPATWRRLECSSPLPRDPFEFQFRGIDGRGRVQLIRDPRNNRGVAVVRIEDRQGGREGYTFDLLWRSGSSGGPGGLRGDRDDRPGRDDRFGRDDGPGRGGFGNPLGGWNREVDFRGRGDGNYRDNRGGNDRLGNCEVRIGRRGDVSVSFDTRRSYALTMNGRLTRVEGDRLVADMSGNGIVGSMIIEVDGNRVRRISMSGAGRERFELRWHD